MENLTLDYTAIGSLPISGQEAPKNACKIVFENFDSIPFWAQLPNYSHNEDMVFQFSENMPGFLVQDGKMLFKTDTEEFCVQIEEFYFDWESIINSENLSECEEILDKYALTEDRSSTFKLFLENLKDKNYKYAKGTITGAFTTSTTICGEDERCAYYDEILRDIVVKSLALKALWQIKEIKKVSPDTTPIIFMDEPSVSQLGSSAFLTVNDDEILNMFNEIASLIKKFGGLAGIHCCGKSNWEIPINAKCDILNFDAYLYTQSMAIYHEKIAKFLDEGGFLAFGIVPTFDDKLIQELTEEDLLEKFEQSVECFVKKGISKEKILKQCFITPACGCGSLSLEGALAVIKHTKNLSKNLKEKYKEILWPQHLP